VLQGYARLLLPRQVILLTRLFGHAMGMRGFVV
jgi:hypothetical protein